MRGQVKIHNTSNHFRISIEDLAKMVGISEEQAMQVYGHYRASNKQLSKIVKRR